MVRKSYIKTTKSNTFLHNCQKNIYAVRLQRLESKPLAWRAAHFVPLGEVFAALCFARWWPGAQRRGRPGAGFGF
jgi:hypothetical protein